MPAHRRLRVAFARLAVALSLVSVSSACAGIGEHRSAALAVVPRGEPRRWASWDEVFASPTPLGVTAYQTGRVEVGADVLIDAGDPRTPASARGRQWVPALAYLVRHPTAGAFLLDSGVPRADARGRCDFGIEPFFHAPCVTAAGQDVASQLASDGVRTPDLRFVLVSHLHGDHAGGLGPLAEGGRVLVALAPQEWAAASRTFRAFDGYIAPQLRAPFDVAEVPAGRAVAMPHTGSSIDLLGDGSVWVFVMPGHTRGELAALLNASSGPMLLTFDVAHLRAGFENSVAPGFTVDRDAARDGVRRLRALAAAYPRLRVIYGHEPSQWPADARRTVLSRAEGEPEAR